MRKISKVSDHLVIFIFLLIIFIPGIGIFVEKKSEHIRALLNRDPHQFPLIKIKRLGRTNFKKIEDWFTDQALFIPTLSKFWSNTVYQLGSSIKPGQVILGKDNWLFLGNDYSFTLDQYTQKNIPTEEEILLNISILKQMKEVANQNNIPFLVAIAPDKHEIYSEYLPDYIHQGKGKSRLDLFQEGMRNSEIDFVDLKQAEIAAKTTLGKKYGDIYLKGDSHWNYLGAYAAYQVISDYMVQKNLQTRQLQFNFTPRQTIYSDLTNFLQISNLASNNPLPDVTNLEINLIGRDLKGNETKLNEFQSSPSIIFTAPYEKINQAVKNKQTCLFIGDSFAEALGFYFHNDFYRTVRVYSNSNNWDLSKLIAKYHPDLIVFEKVQRDLSTPFVNFQKHANLITDLSFPTSTAVGHLSSFKIRKNEISVSGWAYIPNMDAGNGDVYLKLTTQNKSYYYSMNKKQVENVNLDLKCNGRHLDLAGFYGKISRENLPKDIFKLSLLVKNTNYIGEASLSKTYKFF